MPAKRTDDGYLGRVFNDRFKVESKIGGGPLGTVYRGVELTTGRCVALKVLPPENSSDQVAVAQFVRESTLLRQLRNVHILTPYDVAHTPDGTRYIAMEMLEGPNLKEVIREVAPLEWQRVFKILTQMCDSLAAAHALGIVHRNLTPENVYLESRPENEELVKISGFRLAKPMREKPSFTTAMGMMYDENNYMSPEQLLGKPLDGRSDIYALGVIAYEMLTARIPFPDVVGPSARLATLKQIPSPPSQVYSSTIPRGVDRVILKCLAKERYDRYADATQLAAALQEVIADPTANTPPAAERSVVLLVADSHGDAASARSSPSTSSSRVPATTISTAATPQDPAGHEARAAAWDNVTRQFQDLECFPPIRSTVVAMLRLVNVLRNDRRLDAVAPGVSHRALTLRLGSTPRYVVVEWNDVTPHGFAISFIDPPHHLFIDPPHHLSETKIVLELYAQETIVEYLEQLRNHRAPT